MRFEPTAIAYACAFLIFVFLFALFTFFFTDNFKQLEALPNGVLEQEEGTYTFEGKIRDIKTVQGGYYATITYDYLIPLYLVLDSSTFLKEHDFVSVT